MRYILKIIFAFIVSGISLIFHIPEARAQQGMTRPIREVVVQGNRDAEERLILDQSDLKVGSYLSGDKVSYAIQKLWDLQIFEDIAVFQHLEGDSVTVFIKVKELPAVHEITYEGNKELKKTDFEEVVKIVPGFRISLWKLTLIRNLIINEYHNKGFLLADVEIVQEGAMSTEVPPKPIEGRVNIKIKINEGRKVKLKRIRFKGVKAISARKLKKIMETNESKWYRSGEFKKNVFDEDKLKIVYLYKSEGYRDASVVSDSMYYDDEKKHLFIDLNIREGQLYSFGKFTLSGNTLYDDEKLMKELLFKEGETYSELTLMESVMNIRLLYNNDGYLRCNLMPIETPVDDRVDIVINIQEGPVYRVKRVVINGNTKTKEKVIRREIEILPGEIFNQTKLDESKRNIMYLNFFSDVDAQYEIKESDVDIHIEVKEKSTGTASMGAGYSERDHLVLNIGLSNNNLFGNGQRLDFSWDEGSRRKSIQIGFREPWLFGTHTDASFDVYSIKRRDFTNAFNAEKRMGGYIRIGRRLIKPRYTSIYLSYRWENLDYNIGTSSIPLYYLTEGRTSSLSAIYVRDSRDLQEFATRGSRVRYTAEIAGGALGGNMNYYKHLIENEFYNPLFWKITFLSRVHIGFLKGYSGQGRVPYAERFMPGGTSLDGFVRGYQNRMVGPLDLGRELGGETMFVMNMELRFPIVKQSIFGILFADAGNSWNTLSDTNPFDLKRSLGVGFRLVAPMVGTIGFDVGYGFDSLAPGRKCSGMQTHFQFGGMY